MTFAATNCAAIPDNLLESELFGHEKGASTVRNCELAVGVVAALTVFVAVCRRRGRAIDSGSDYCQLQLLVVTENGVIPASRRADVRK